MVLMVSVQDAWALTWNAEAATARLWSDPAAFGTEVGLRGAALAEFVGSIRSATQSRDEGSAAMTLIFASIEVESGRAGWPFSDAPLDEWPSFVALTEFHTKALVSAGFYAIDLDETIIRHRANWAKALQDEAVRRAESLDHPIPAEVADALIAALALADACHRSKSST